LPATPAAAAAAADAAALAADAAKIAPGAADAAEADAAARQTAQDQAAAVADFKTILDKAGSATQTTTNADATSLATATAAAAAAAAKAAAGKSDGTDSLKPVTIATTVVGDAADSTRIAAQPADSAAVADTTATPKAGDTVSHIDTKAAPTTDTQPQVSQTQQQQQNAADPAKLAAAPQAAAVKTDAEAAATLKEQANITIAPTASHAAQEIAKAATVVPTDKLSSRVGSQAWDQQLGQKIIFMAAGGEQSATMELNPPDLGPLQVVLSVNKDQATAAFSSATPEVRQALENALPKLKEMMSEAGIQLGSATVSSSMSDQSNSSFNQQASSAQSGGSGGGSGRSGGSYGRDTNNQADAARSAPPVRRLPAGAVDTFA
ncbi:flagellar hook-length control protein FliK, partial [Duganella levis]